jgi:hypothetical protein
VSKKSKGIKKDEKISKTEEEIDSPLLISEKD